MQTPGATTPMEAMHMHGPAGSLSPGASAMPQDVRLTPDGTGSSSPTCSATASGCSTRARSRSAVPATGKGAHGIYPDRDATRLFVSNRDERHDHGARRRDPATLRTWRLPGGGSPDMGGVTADGRTLWLSGRYDASVYVLDTRPGSC